MERVFGMGQWWSMQIGGQGRSKTRSFTRHTSIRNPAAMEQHQKGGDKQKRQQSARVCASVRFTVNGYDDTLFYFL